MNESTKAVKQYLDQRVFAFYEEDIENFKQKLKETISYCGRDEAKEALILLALRDVDWVFLYRSQSQRFESEKESGDYDVPF